MNPVSREAKRRASLAIAVMLSACSGCATRTSSLQPAVSASSPDLMTVSAVTPALNALVDKAKGAPESRNRAEPATADAGLQATALQNVSDDRAQPLGPTPPVSATAEATPPSIPQSSAPLPIDLATALRLADGQNPIIGEARTLILGALAERQAARALLLPSLNAGTDYHDHNGPLQRGSGAILRVHEQSLYVGGGSGVAGSGTLSIPMVNISSPLADAIFEPLAAQQRVVAARSRASETANQVLLEVASLYLELIGAEAILEARRLTAVEADRFAKILADYAATGQGRQADAQRGDSDRRLYQAEIQKAEERLAVTSARLAQSLNLDPSAMLKPLAGPLEPLDLISAETSTDELIRQALRGRPDLAAREALVAQADYRVQQEKARPLLPTIWLGFSAGAYGGGSNLTATPLGSFAGRTDFDVVAYWTLLNFGAGNASLIKQRRSQKGEAIADRARVMNRIRAEVSSARADSIALRAQVANARRGLESAEQGYRLDRTRLNESLARPIEALDSLRLLGDARVALVEAITRANQSQFALFVSLGAPPPLDTTPH